MDYFAGIDLHSDSNFTGVIDQEDRRRFQKKLPNDRNVIKENLEPYKKHIRGVVVESTYNWYWLVDELMDVEETRDNSDCF